MDALVDTIFEYFDCMPDEAKLQNNPDDIILFSNQIITDLMKKIRKISVEKYLPLNISEFRKI